MGKRSIHSQMDGRERGADGRERERQGADVGLHFDRLGTGSARPQACLEPQPCPSVLTLTVCYWTLDPYLNSGT